MGFRIEKLNVAYVSTTMQPIDPEYMAVDENVLREYLKAHPMPLDPSYSEESLIHDLCHSSGMLTLPMELKEETADHICEVIGQFI